MDYLKFRIMKFMYDGEREYNNTVALTVYIKLCRIQKKNPNNIRFY